MSTASGNGSDWRSLLTEIDWPRVRDRFGLSVRELQVVRHTLEGNSVGQVAEHLDLAVGTVKTYTSRIHAKLGVKNRCELSLARTIHDIIDTEAIRAAAPCPPLR